MRLAFAYRLVALSAFALGLGICWLPVEPGRAATLTWSGAGGATWDTTSNNWNGATVGTPWDSTNGPGDQANFYAAGSSANLTGNNVYVFAISFGTAAGGLSATGCSITGGTINTTSSSFSGNSPGVISMIPTSGTDTISSAIVFGNTTKTENITTVAGSAAELNLTGPITSNGTVALNAGGTSTNASPNGSTIALGGTDSFNILQETNGNHGTILVGGSVSANFLFVGNYCAQIVNGSLTCQNLYCNTSNAGQQIFGGSGSVSAINSVMNHSGTVNFGTATFPYTGSFTVSGSFNVGFGSNPFPPLGAGIGTQGAGDTVLQTSGSVLLTGTGDLVTMGFGGTNLYKLQGGFLSIPNTSFELGVGNANTFTSTYNQTGGLANIYGLSMGTTQNFGAQPGNCTITVTGGTLNLGAGGIVSGGVATYSTSFGNATIGATAPWTTSVPVKLNNSTTATFNTGGGNISLTGVLSGGGGLTAAGGGTLLLDAANTYTGGTNVASGTLQLGDGTANVGSLTSNVNASSGAVVLYAVPGSNTATYSNAMSGSGSLVVAGPGTLVVNGTNNSFTGGTTISGGTLQLGDGGSNNGSLSSPVTNNSGMVFNNPQPQTFAAAVSGSGPVYVNGPAALALTGNNNTFSGGVTLASNATLYVNSNTALGSGTLTINGGVVDSTTAGVALGNVPQAWNSDFAFGGTNNLNLGTGPVLLGSSRTVTLNGGVLTVNGPISDGGAGYSLSVTSPSGTGTLVLGGTSNYSGGTNVNSGA